MAENNSEETASTEEANAEATENESSTEESSTEAEASTSQNHIDNEHKEVKEKTSRTEKEKAAYALKKNAEKARSLGVDVKTVLELGEEDSDAGDDDQPFTHGDWKRKEQERAKTSALTMADSIEDVKERELVRHHIENTIKPSGDPARDLANARAIVNSVKNGQIAEEMNRRKAGKSHSSNSGAPGKTEGEFVPTPEEEAMMKMKGLDGKPLLNKEDIIKSRKGAQV